MRNETEDQDKQPPVDYEKIRSSLDYMLRLEASDDLNYMVSGPEVIISLANVDTSAEIQDLFRRNYSVLFSLLSMENVKVLIDAGGRAPLVPLTVRLLKELSGLSL